MGGGGRDVHACMTVHVSVQRDSVCVSMFVSVCCAHVQSHECVCVYIALVSHSVSLCVLSYFSTCVTVSQCVCYILVSPYVCLSICVFCLFMCVFCCMIVYCSCLSMCVFAWVVISPHVCDCRSECACVSVRVSLGVCVMFLSLNSCVCQCVCFSSLWLLCLDWCVCVCAVVAVGGMSSMCDIKNRFSLWSWWNNALWQGEVFHQSFILIIDSHLDIDEMLRCGSGRYFIKV